MKVFIGLLGLLMAMLFTNCQKDDILPTDDEQKRIMDCRDDGLINEMDIRDNLIGQWKQIGYGCGFCAPHDEPESSIIFQNETGTLSIKDDFNGQQTISFSWSIAKGDTISGKPTFQLITNPSHYALQMEVFCSKYIAFDHTPLDGHMFLYKKK